MPLNLGRRRRRQPHGLGDEETNLSVPKGWATIEDYMLSHDDETIGDFADDIDTLLVFAGLFSAVVTAFVIVSYTMLQPDNTQLSVQLLSMLAIQSGGFAGSESFLNSTAATLPSSASFQPPLSAITINSLWFTSLILSLASALYGILAKHWCREYLKWNSVLSPARENVLVRHMRFEAWERWKVPALIAAIPALLEIALVLFLSGLIIFLWTLEKTVAIILTIFIGLSLSIALIITVLPVFSPRCPYRSPTGWALTKSWHLVLQCCRSLKRRLGPKDRRSPERRVRPFQDWRERELYPLDHPQAVVSPSEMLAHRWKAYFPDSLQVEILLRALTWAHRGSVEGQLSSDIPQCMLSLHSNHTDGQQDVNVLVTLQALHVMSGATLRLPSFQQDFLGPMCKQLSGKRISDPFDQGMFEVCSFRSVSLMKEGCFYVNGPFINHPLTFRRDGHLQDHPWITRRLLLQDLRGLVTLWIQEALRFSSVVKGYKSLTKMVAMMLCLLRCYGVGGWRPDESDTRELAYVLCAIYKKLGPIDAAYETGLISMVAEILCLTGEVIVDRHDHSVFVHKYVALHPGPRRNIANNLTSFARRVYEHNPGYSWSNDRHLFVMAADAAVRFYFTEYHEYTAPSKAILSYMLRAAQLSLHKSYKNCGAYVDLPWISSLVERFRCIRKDWGITSMKHKSFVNMLGNKAILFQLLSLIQESLNIGLITGEGAQEQFDELLQLTGSPELPFVGHEIANDDVLPGGPEPGPSRHEEIPRAASKSTRFMFPEGQSDVRLLPCPKTTGITSYNGVIKEFDARSKIVSELCVNDHRGIISIFPQADRTMGNRTGQHLSIADARRGDPTSPLVL